MARVMSLADQRLRLCFLKISSSTPSSFTPLVDVGLRGTEIGVRLPVFLLQLAHVVSLHEAVIAESLVTLSASSIEMGHPPTSSVNLRFASSLPGYSCMFEEI